MAAPRPPLTGLPRKPVLCRVEALANDMDVPVTKTTKKAELIDTLAAETVTVPAEADDTEPDFGEV